MKKILIHDERADALEFLLGSIVGCGYRAGIARDSHEILSMLSDGAYDIVLTNGNYKALEQEHHYRLKSSSVFVIGIKDPKRGNEAMDPVVDLYLYRPFSASELKQVLKNRGKALPSF